MMNRNGLRFFLDAFADNLIDSLVVVLRIFGGP